jgi:iron-sulfur cluster assembly accessory protein
VYRPFQQHPETHTLFTKNTKNPISLTTNAIPGGHIMITLTETAAGKVKELLDAEGDLALALRVAVRPGGCSGFSYEMFFDADRSEDDQTVDLNGVRVVVDASSAPLLSGATLDYKDGLQGAGFNIDNPNATKSCGCGKSFS